MSIELHLGIGGHQSASSRTDEWLTPPDILRALGPFDLDPCAPAVRPWPTAARHLTLADDGLHVPWEGRVWLNPPYGPATFVWLRRLARHGDGIALTFARTETTGFFDGAWDKADAMLFIRGRLHFHHLDGSRSEINAGGPSVLLAYGARNVDALFRSRIPGAFIRSWWRIPVEADNPPGSRDSEEHVREDHGRDGYESWVTFSEKPNGGHRGTYVWFPL